MKITTQIQINRPLEEVFAYVSNYLNDPVWIAPMVEARQTPGPPPQPPAAQSEEDRVNALLMDLLANDPLPVKQVNAAAAGISGPTLRPWRVEDARWYVKSRDEAVFEWTTEKRDLTVAETEDAIKQANNNPDALSFAIVDGRSKTICGNIALVLEQNDSSIAEIMYWLAPWGRGRGIATNAVKLLCE